jgi:predicted small secreted protein
MKTHLIFAAIALASLAACGDKTQTIGQDIRSDTAAFQGTGKPFTAAGWKQGDKTSWEQQLKTRAQTGQNEYAKVN